MPNIELLEKATPVAPIRIAALAGCQDLAKEVDKKLVKFRKELVAKEETEHCTTGILPSFFPCRVRMRPLRYRRGQGLHQRICTWCRSLYHGRYHQLHRNLHRMRS